MIHDDLLATGGTVGACDSLVKQLGCTTAGFLFIIELEGCKGREKLKKISPLSI